MKKLSSYLPTKLLRRYITKSRQGEKGEGTQFQQSPDGQKKSSKGLLQKVFQRKGYTKQSQEANKENLRLLSVGGAGGPRAEVKLRKRWYGSGIGSRALER